MSWRRNVATDAGFKTEINCEMQRDLCGGDQLNQQHLNFFGK